MPHKIKLGVTAGPHADILAYLKAPAAQEGIDLEIIEFNDFILPNAALDQEEIDANIYQHQVFLDDQISTRGYQLIPVAKTILLPMGIYSHKHKNLQSLETNSRVAIPNDPTNGGRALLLLEKNGLIRLNPESGSNPSPLDVIENPKHIELIEMEAPQLPRTLEEVDLAVINTDWVLLSGLDPSEALASEGSSSPYVNLIVAKKGKENNNILQKFIKMYQSPSTKKFIQEKFGKAILAAW
jgi:D-methionine transport system substrate-binding protein